MYDMSASNKQFVGFVKFLMLQLKDALNFAQDNLTKEQEDKFNIIIDTLQGILED